MSSSHLAPPSGFKHVRRPSLNTRAGSAHNERRLARDAVDKSPGGDPLTPPATGPPPSPTQSPAQTRVAVRAARFKGFDTSAGARFAPVKEVHVSVRRGDYSQVRVKVVNGGNGIYVLTGPTGCGKSTVALLPLLAGAARVLIVEPTQANAANILHEFRVVVPTLASRVPGIRKPPAVAFVAPTVAPPNLPQLLVTTSEKYCESLEHFGKPFPCDYLVIDEYHLPIPSMVKMVEYARSFALCSKIIFVSATAVGVKIEAALPPAVTEKIVRIPVGKLPSPIEGSVLDPRRWRRKGDGTFGIVAPSEGMAKELAGVYRGWNLRVHLITRTTSVSSYMAAVKSYKPATVFVLEPGVEAGVTLAVAVLVSMGASSAIRYDGRVVFEDVQPLDPVAAIQRGGRGGRVVPTLYMRPASDALFEPSSTASYYRAQAYVYAVAMGASEERYEGDPLFATFPRLSTLRQSTAIAAVSQGTDPFVAVYKLNDEGKVYRECGGDGDGFEALVKDDLYLYYYARSFFVAPIVDLSTSTSVPDSFVERKSQLKAALAMVGSRPGLEEKYKPTKLIDMLKHRFSTYVDDWFNLFSTLTVPGKAIEWSLRDSDEPPKLRSFFFAVPELLSLFEFMAEGPCGIVYREINGTTSSGKLTTSFEYRYKDKRLPLNFLPRFKDATNMYKVSAVAAEAFQLLRQLLAVEILVDGAPDRCVALSKYAGKAGGQHKWFNDNVGVAQK